MVCQTNFDQWLRTLMPHRAHWNTPQATGLALGSCGMVLARSCALSAGSHRLAKGMQRQEQTVRQPLRAWYDDTPRKRGAKRHALQVEPCCAPRLGWVLSWGQGTPMALALAATTLGPRLVVLALSVGYRGCALPVAWGMVPTGVTRAWRREWLRRFRRLHRAIPWHWPVCVLADCGLDAPGRLRRILRVGWHPFVRSNTEGRLRPEGAPCWCPCLRWVPRPGTRWRGTGIACTRPQGPGTLLAQEGARAPGVERALASQPIARAQHGGARRP